MANGIVLLVEDNSKILNVNRLILENEGLVALTARTIAEARSRLKIATPDAVVLDIMLPDGNGLDFLSELRETCSAPVLFLTVKSARSDIIAGLAAGGNDYITKPYDIDEFRARVLGLIRLVDSVRTKQAQAALRPSASALTERELAIALLAAEGMPNKNIAEKCSLSESRVKNCLSDIYRKMDIVDQKNKRLAMAKMLYAE